MNKMQRANYNVATTDIVESGHERDWLGNIGRIFNYLDDHPNVGFMVGCTLTGGGIGALLYYGRKILSSKIQVGD